ncbi:hypothetical protein C7M84_009871 [Penaeus vannamei]|uniref:Uncharacterized protein n=1 Tax=Penaeus vannamei TaxID=6689 RepID=A0A423T5L8_PENVA|nr:hypothetical protein C7M84_009871 [Penaeus vannamei]
MAELLVCVKLSALSSLRATRKNRGTGRQHERAAYIPAGHGAKGQRAWLLLCLVVCITRLGLSEADQSFSSRLTLSFSLSLLSRILLSILSLISPSLSSLLSRLPIPRPHPLSSLSLPSSHLLSSLRSRLFLFHILSGHFPLYNFLTNFFFPSPSFSSPLLSPIVIVLYCIIYPFSYFLLFIRRESFPFALFFSSLDSLSSASSSASLHRSSPPFISSFHLICLSLRHHLLSVFISLFSATVSRLHLRSLSLSLSSHFLPSPRLRVPPRLYLPLPSSSFPALPLFPPSSVPLSLLHPPSGPLPFPALLSRVRPLPPLLAPSFLCPYQSPLSPHSSSFSPDRLLSLIDYLVPLLLSSSSPLSLIPSSPLSLVSSHLSSLSLLFLPPPFPSLPSRRLPESSPSCRPPTPPSASPPLASMPSLSLISSSASPHLFIISLLISLIIVSQSLSLVCCLSVLSLIFSHSSLSLSLSLLLSFVSHLLSGQLMVYFVLFGNENILQLGFLGVHPLVTLPYSNYCAVFCALSGGEPRIPLPPLARPSRPPLRFQLLRS